MLSLLQLQTMSNENLFPLGERNVYVGVSTYNNIKYITFREFKEYLGSTTKYPTRNGISFTLNEYLVLLEAFKRVSQEMRRVNPAAGRLFTKEIGAGKFCSLEWTDYDQGDGRLRKSWLVKLETGDNPEKQMVLNQNMFEEFLRVKEDISKRIEV